MNGHFIINDLEWMFWIGRFRINGYFRVDGFFFRIDVFKMNVFFRMDISEWTFQNGRFRVNALKYICILIRVDIQCNMF